MSDILSYENILPIAPLKIAALEGCRDLAQRVDHYLVQFRQKSNQNFQNTPSFQGYHEASFMIRSSCPRFGTGEAKGILYDSVRGADLFILADVMNHSLFYTVCGHKHYMSPDDHYQDLKRIISASTGKAHRINVIMPFLYEGRQHKRQQRESLDCAFALQELVDMGVTNIITFDAHDPRVCNSIPLYGFDSFNPPYQFIKGLIRAEPDLQIDKDHLMVISPDEGAMERAVYFAGVLGVDMGMFYKRRDYSVIIHGKNPIVAHEFLGDDLTGKDVIIIDDMISSGESILDVARQIKERGAKRVFLCATFGLFTDGLDKFDEYYEKGYISHVVTTNLNYRNPELLSKPYYVEASMTKFLAAIIDCINHDVSTERVNDPTRRIHNLLEEIERDDDL